MHISNDRYFHDRQRHDLALRMIRHEARTCTIRSCTGLTDDRIRRLYKTYASHMPSAPVRRRRGKSPRQVAFFMRNTRAQFESSMLASVFATFGLWRMQSSVQLAIGPGRIDRVRPLVLRRVRNASPAAAQRRHLVRACVVPAAAADRATRDLHAVRCRHCDSQYLRDRINVCRRTCPVCALKRTRATRERRDGYNRAHGVAALSSQRVWLDRISNAPRTGARTKSVCARRSPIRRRCSCRSGTRAALSWLRRTDVLRAYFVDRRADVRGARCERASSCSASSTSMSCSRSRSRAKRRRRSRAARSCTTCA